MTKSNLSAQRQPFLYLTATFVAGIVIEAWLRPAFSLAAGLAFVSLGVALAFVISRKSQAAGISLLIAFLAAGLLISRASNPGLSTSAVSYLYDTGGIRRDSPVELVGTLSRPPEPAPHSYYLDIEVESIGDGNDLRTATGLVQLIAPLADEEARLEFDKLGLDYGRRMRVLVRLERPQEFRNAGSPDFNEYLEREGYQLRGTIKSPLLIEPLAVTPVNPILAALFHFRQMVIGSIDERVRAPVSGTLKAMLLDNRHFLDRVIADQLRQAGTFHVISISGMHVGIIALLLLGGASRVWRRRRLWVCVVMLVLWGYAVMVGLAPPVVRATVMITVGLVGPLLFRRAASINTVAFAALLMLAFKPTLVADPGFQLSFVAVAGIVLLVLPLNDRIRSIGDWRPSSSAPRPPSCSRPLRWIAEVLFWNERSFQKEMQNAPVSFSVDKSRAAIFVNRVYLQPLLRAGAIVMLTSAAIQITTLPLTAIYFNRVAPIGVLLNVAAGLLTAVLMAAGTLITLAGSISDWFGSQFESVAFVAHYGLANAIVPFADIPGATMRIAHYEGWHRVIYVLYFVPVLSLAVLIDRWRPVGRRRESFREARDSSSRQTDPRIERGGFKRIQRPVVLWSLCLIALVVSAVATMRPLSPSPTGKLAVHFLDVGQGDSALIVFPGGSTMLVDGGGQLDLGAMRRLTTSGTSNSDSEAGEASGPGIAASSSMIGEKVVSRFLWSTGRTRVDYLLATHGHADHVGGLFQVADNFRVGQAIVGPMQEAGSVPLRFKRDLGRNGIPIGEITAGETFHLEGVTIKVLWPPRSSLQAISENNDSVVLRLVFGSVAVLFAGDIEREAEDALARSGVNLRADVLKIPHHGSKTSSSAEFVDLVKPSFAVLSVGERSRFGHPDPQVVSTYLDRNVVLFQTGRDGTVTVETDGARLQVSSFIGSEGRVSPSTSASRLQ
jgi:competence protein ComEC